MELGYHFYGFCFRFSGVETGTWSGKEAGTLAGVMIRGLWIAGGAISGEKSLPLRVTLAGPVMLLTPVLVSNSCFTPRT